MSPAGRRTQVGTLAWARETRGILRPRDRWEFLGQAILYGLAMMPWEIRRALGIRRRPLERLDPSVLEPPDSRTSREAERLVAEGTSAMVANHSHRTYAFAVALAANDSVRFDREVVYVASLLHDLYAEHPRTLPVPHCFTLPEADRTLALASVEGWEERRAGVAAEAITLHANLWPPRHSAEAYLVFAGSRLDNLGYRYWDLDRETVRAVLERHPRLHFKRNCVPIFEAQALANPGSRMHFMTRYLAALWFIRRAPFEE